LNLDPHWGEDLGNYVTAGVGNFVIVHTCAKTPFNLDPDNLIGEEDRFADWSHTIGRAIFPLSELDEGRFFLGIDENSEIYLVETWRATFGDAQEALEKFIPGIAPERIETTD